MAHQINPGLARLWIRDNERQYGYRNPVSTGSLHEDQMRLLDYLEMGVTNSQFATLANLAKISTDRAEATIASIKKSIWSGDVTTSQEQIDTRFAEIARIYLAGLDPVSVLRTRSSKSIFIEKLDATGFTISKALSLAGVGKMISLDQKRISAEDIGPLSYSNAELGAPRVRAAQNLIGRALEFHSRISRSLDTVSIAILIANDIVNPASYQKWMSRDVPHISICFDEEGVAVSPIISPGLTPCLGCMELYELSHRENWSVISPQLLALERSLADSPSLLFACGVALNAVLNFIDEGRPSPNTLRLNRKGEVIELAPKSISCGCRGTREIQKARPSER